MARMGAMGRSVAVLGLLAASSLAADGLTEAHEKGRCALRGQCGPLAASSDADAGLTKTHEKGRCALRGQCGKQSIFGSELPCPDNGKARDPAKDVRKKLVDICGPQWSDGPVCCEEDQLDVLASNFQTVDNFVASCPACQSNFKNLFCTFTCSPDQSTFVNVTHTEPKDDKLLVTELDQLWSDEYASTFYDSCKDVKFGAANTPAMSFIGGGAKNYTQLLSFLGDKKLVGSPFQINFPRPASRDFPGMTPAEQEARQCNSEDDNYRCTCLDCAASCPKLRPVQEANSCHVGSWPCLTFSVVLIYALSVFLLALALTGHVAYRKHTQHRNERLRLLQDTAASDDDDDDGHDLSLHFNHTSGPTRRYWLNTLCDRMFNKLGRICARYPAITISVSFFLVALLSLGWIRFDIERDPVKLWVAPDSAAAQEKAFFDTHFGPFYRAEQAFLVNDTASSGPGPVLSYETLSWWFDVESRVSRLKSRQRGVNLRDVCFNPTGSGCVVQSVTGYWEHDFSQVAPGSWDADLEECIANPVLCLPPSQNPIDPKLVLGGNNSSPLDSPAIITTWVVKNGLDGSPEEVSAMDWEEEMKNLMHQVQIEADERGLRMSFNTEISLEQELNKSTNTDAKIVVVSYIVMFLYASLALGSTTLAVRQVMRNPTVALVQSKFMLGIVGIVIVLFSVSASVGLFSAAGIKVTLIIAEVIPFLVLAVGVDNIFLIVHEFERVNNSHPNELIEERLAKALGRMGPSILLSASMETIAFALGAFVGMPAVRNFAVYAAGAVVINALLQITMFVSTLALNQRRVESGRADCVPCMTVQQAIMLPDEGLPEDSGLQHFIRRYYAPSLLGRKTKVAILTLFLGLFTAGLALIPSVKLGLDQRIAIPEDSYLIAYFNDLYDYLETGPPVYFVSRDLNVTARDRQQQLCGRFPSCGQYSLSNILEQERKRPEISYIASPTASWVDDFFLWLDPSLDKCCVDDKTGKPCFAGREPGWNRTLHGMPEGQEYISYLKKWLGTPPSEDCPLGGLAGYSTAIYLPSSREEITIPASHFRTSHTSLRSQDDFISAYKAARRISEDINANNPGASIFPYSTFYIFFDQYTTIVRLSVTLLAAALACCFVVSTILLGSIRTGLVVAVVVTMTIVDIAGAMAVANVSLNAVTLVNLVISVGIAVEFCAHIARAFQFPASRLLADASAVAASASTPRSNSTGLFSLLGPKGPRMPRFGRQPSSFTNARLASNPAAAGSQSSSAMRDARAWAALTQVGASVFSGITLTKLLGVAVLAFSRSKIFEVYFFRVWLALVLLAALHALVFLPVALSLFGGPAGWIGEDGSDGDGAYDDGAVGVQEDLRRRMRGNRAGYGDDDESDDGF